MPAAGGGRLRRLSRTEPGVLGGHVHPAHRCRPRRRIPGRRRMPVCLHRVAPGARLCRTGRSDRAALFARPARRGDQHQQWSGHHDCGLPFGKPAVSVAGEFKPPAAKRTRPGARSWWRCFLANTREWLALLGRRPDAGVARPAWRAPVRLALGFVVALVIIAGTMALLDAPMIIAV